MDIQAEKLELVQAILDMEDIGLIKKVKKLIAKRTESHDWFDDLSEEQQQAVDEAIAELDRGEGIPHEDVMRMLGL